MRTLALILALISTALLADESESPSNPSDAAEIARLVKQLDADAFGDREAAGAALMKIGEDAKAAVQKAIESSESAEVRKRGEQLLRQFRIQELRRTALRLDVVYQMARDVSDGKAKAEDLEPLVDRILEVIAAADPAAAKKSPLRISACKPVALTEPAAGGELYIGQPLHPGALRSTVILDAGGRISQATNSIVIAWGVLDMVSASNSIVIAGADVSINSARDCLILAGGNLTLASAFNSSLGAGEPLTQGSFSEHCYLLNTKAPEARPGARAGEVVELKVADLILREKPVMEELLAEKLTPTVMRGDFMIFKVSGQPGEFVARPGNELLDPFGKPIAGLEGWKIDLIAPRFATFSRDKERTLVRFKRP
jgi:hypothetical protein